MTETGGGVPIERLEVSAYDLPTDAPESDGTLTWDHTTLVLVEVEGGGKHGLGFTYADRATATLIRHTLAEQVVGRDGFGTEGTGSRSGARSGTWG